MSKSEVYRHREVALSQCDSNELFSLELNGKIVDFRLCDLIAFKRKIFNINLSLLLDVDNPDIEILYLPHNDSHLLLSIHDILSLREVLSGGFTLLQLNSDIHRALYNPFVGQLQA